MSSDAGSSISTVLDNEILVGRLTGVDPRVAAAICMDWQPADGITDSLVAAVAVLGINAGLVFSKDNQRRSQVDRQSVVGRRSSGTRVSLSISVNALAAQEVQLPGKLARRLSTSNAGKSNKVVAIASLCRHFFEPLLTRFTDILAEKGVDETDRRTEAERLAFVRDGAELFQWVCRRHKVSPLLAEFCLTNHAVKIVTLLLCKTMCKRASCEMPLIEMLRILLACPECGERQYADCADAGFFIIPSEYFTEWVKHVLATKGLIEVRLFLTRYVEVAVEVLKHPSIKSSRAFRDLQPTFESLLRQGPFSNPILRPLVERMCQRMDVDIVVPGITPIRRSSLIDWAAVSAPLDKIDDHSECLDSEDDESAVDDDYEAKDAWQSGPPAFPGGERLRLPPICAKAKAPVVSGGGDEASNVVADKRKNVSRFMTAPSGRSDVLAKAQSYAEMEPQRASVAKAVSFAEMDPRRTSVAQIPGALDGWTKLQALGDGRLS